MGLGRVRRSSANLGRRIQEWPRVVYRSPAIAIASSAPDLLFAFVINNIANYYLTVQDLETVAWWYNIYIPTVLVTDMLLTANIAYFLMRTKRDAMPDTVGIISALVRSTFQTAATAAIWYRRLFISLVIVNFIVAQTFPNHVPGARRIASGAVQTVVPDFYVFSMMWTLNERKDIRESLFTTEVSAASRFALSAPEVKFPVMDAERPSDASIGQEL
ncbi:hypothetical protein DFH09DRAFT_1317771 [Mycena vulgaris]|nr:hypothetical protein DFH09DRAFT_1317771 [Mycena vulgaris]